MWSWRRPVPGGNEGRLRRGWRGWTSRGWRVPREPATRGGVGCRVVRRWKAGGRVFGVCDDREGTTDLSERLMKPSDEQRVRELGLREWFGSCEGRVWDGVSAVATVRDGVDGDG